MKTKNKKPMCQYCGKNEVTTYDYRDFNGCVGKYLSCVWCKYLNNKTIREIQEKHLDPKQFYKIKVYSITFMGTWSKMIKARSEEEAIEIFTKYTNGTPPEHYDKKFKIELMTHKSWYKDKECLKTTGIYNGEGAKRSR